MSAFETTFAAKNDDDDDDGDGDDDDDGDGDDDDGDDDDTRVMGKFGGNGNGRRVEERRQEAEEKANLLDETRASYHEARGFHPRHRQFFFCKKKGSKVCDFPEYSVGRGFDPEIKIKAETEPNSQST